MRKKMREMYQMMWSGRFFKLNLTISTRFLLLENRLFLWQISLKRLILPVQIRLQSFRPQFLQLLPICQPFTSDPFMILISRQHGNFVKPLVLIRLSIPLSTSCSYNLLPILFPDLSGIKLSKTIMSTFKNCMHLWIEVTATKTMRKNLLEDSLLCERIIILRRNLLRWNLNGVEYLSLGELELNFFILIIFKSFKAIRKWSSTSFALHQLIQLLLFNLILKLVIAMRVLLITWTTAVDFIFHSFLRCFRNVTWIFRNHPLISELWSLVKTGVLEYVSTPVLITGSMGYAVNAEDDTKRVTNQRASLHLKLAEERRLALAIQKAEAAEVEGPRSLYDQDRKRKGDTIIDPPRYRRGFVWPDSDM